MLSLPAGRPNKPPRVDLVPESDDFSAAVEALEIAELAGLTLDDWQQYALAAGMGMSGGRWSAFECGLIVPRQNGKTEILVARILAGLFTELDDPRLVVFTAHEYKTAREVFLRLRFLLDPPRDADPLLVADPLLRGQVKTIRTANGEESVELENGRRCRFLARTSGSGRGFTGDLLMLDEAYKLAAEQMGALLPTLGARPNPQVYYASMGPFEDSDQQLSLQQRGLAGESGLCYLEWSAAEDAELDDPEVWAAANPAHPHRKSDAQLRKEWSALKGEPEVFAREILAMRVSSIQVVISHPMWAAVQDPAAAPDGGLVFGVDVNPERSHVALAVADREGRVELVDHRLVVAEGSENVAAWVIEKAKAVKAPVAVDEAGPAASLIPHLEAAGVEVRGYSGRDMAAASGQFFDLIAEGVLKVRTHTALDNARAGATQRPLGDAWAWGRRKSSVDISPLVAATLAVDAAVKPSREFVALASWV